MSAAPKDVNPTVRTPIATGEKVENNHDPRRVRPSGMTYTEELVTWRCMQKMALGACVGICIFLGPRLYMHKLPIKLPWKLGITFPISGIWVGYTHCKNEATKLLPEDSILRKKLDHREE